jgi:tripartite-type tricarboxylate transporter receptor subunit TctC
MINGKARVRFAVAMAALMTCCLFAAGAQATWPAKGKSIQLWIGYAAGSGTDAGARMMAAGLEKELGVSIVPVNKPGASSQLMYTELSKAKADGYTFGTINFPSAIVSYVDPERKATYTKANFELLALHIVDPGIIAVLPNSPYKTLADLVNAAKANPRKVTITTSGVQSDEHFALLQLQEMTGAEFAFVHFSQGAAAAIAPFLGGKVDAYTGNVADVIAQYKAGQVRILGVMDDVRSRFYPEVKTFEEQGYKLYNSANRGYAVPAGTPKAVVDKLSAAMKKVMETPEHMKQVEDMGLTIRYLNPEQYSKFWDDYAVIVKRLLPLSKE